MHQAYIEAGAQIIETNTFSANRYKLAISVWRTHVVEFNHRGVKLAREARDAAKHEVLIAGSIGPLGIFSHVRQLPREEMLAVFKEQAGRSKSAASIFSFSKRSATSKNFSLPSKPSAPFRGCPSSRR